MMPTSGLVVVKFGELGGLLSNGIARRKRSDLLVKSQHFGPTRKVSFENWDRRDED
jgi:hypothetical protein